MTKKRRQYSADFKFRVALEAAKENRTIPELASLHGIHPTQIREWKRQLLAEGAGIFGRQRQQEQKAQEERETELYEQIGRLKMELEWLGKKVAAFS
jgi:putative transposase